jgi:hypothetical protein
MLLLDHNAVHRISPAAPGTSRRARSGSSYLGSAQHLPTAPLRSFLIADEKILKTELTPSVPIPNVFLIAGVCPAFSPAAAPRISNRYSRRLEIDLTHSQQTRKYFLIGTIRPTFTAAPLLIHRVSPITHHCLTSFLFDTNKPHIIIILMRPLMETKEKPRSIRYKFAPRKMLRFTTHQSPRIPSRREPPKPASNIRSPLPRKLLFLPLNIPQRAI